MLVLVQKLAKPTRAEGKMMFPRLAGLTCAIVFAAAIETAPAHASTVDVTISPTGGTVDVDFGYLAPSSGNYSDGVELSFANPGNIAEYFVSFPSSSSPFSFSSGTCQSTMTPGSSCDAIVQVSTNTVGSFNLTQTIYFPITAPAGDIAPQPAPVTFDISADVGVSATPLPATLPLFASALALIGLLGWFINRKGGSAIAAV
jgi:hypothetical protein